MGEKNRFHRCVKRSTVVETLPPWRKRFYHKKKRFHRGEAFHQSGNLLWKSRKQGKAACPQARIQGGGAKGALPPPSPQKIAPPNSQARIQGGQEGLGPPLQNPGSAYGPLWATVVFWVKQHVPYGPP